MQPQKIKSNGNKRYQSKSAKRANILKAAEKIFAKNGFHETTIGEIAKTARVSEGTIYEYFSTKEALLFSIPGERSSRYMAENLEILKYVDQSANKLKILIYRHLELFEINPEYANVTIMILRNNRNFLKTHEYQIVKASAKLTIDVLKEGIRTGEFRSDIDPYVVRSIIWGSIDDAVKRKFLYKKKTSLLEFAESLVDTLFNGILTPKKPSPLNLHMVIEQPKEAETTNVDGDRPSGST